jgi:hypothetical protein
MHLKRIAASQCCGSWFSVFSSDSVAIPTSLRLQNVAPLRLLKGVRVRRLIEAQKNFSISRMEDPLPGMRYGYGAAATR